MSKSVQDSELYRGGGETTNDIKTSNSTGSTQDSSQNGSFKLGLQHPLLEPLQCANKSSCQLQDLYSAFSSLSRSESEQSILLELVSQGLNRSNSSLSSLELQHQQSQHNRSTQLQQRQGSLQVQGKFQNIQDQLKNQPLQMKQSTQWDDKEQNQQPRMHQQLYSSFQQCQQQTLQREQQKQQYHSPQDQAKQRGTGAQDGAQQETQSQQILSNPKQANLKETVSQQQVQQASQKQSQQAQVLPASKALNNFSSQNPVSVTPEQEQARAKQQVAQIFSGVGTAFSIGNASDVSSRTSDQWFRNIRHTSQPIKDNVQPQQIKTSQVPKDSSQLLLQKSGQPSGKQPQLPDQRKAAHQSQQIDRDQNGFTQMGGFPDRATSSSEQHQLENNNQDGDNTGGNGSAKFNRKGTIEDTTSNRHNIRQSIEGFVLREGGVTKDIDSNKLRSYNWLIQDVKQKQQSHLLPQSDDVNQGAHPRSYNQNLFQRGEVPILKIEEPSPSPSNESFISRHRTQDSAFDNCSAGSTPFMNSGRRGSIQRRQSSNLKMVSKQQTAEFDTTQALLHIFVRQKSQRNKVKLQLVGESHYEISVQQSDDADQKNEGKSTQMQPQQQQPSGNNFSRDDQEAEMDLGTDDGVRSVRLQNPLSYYDREELELVPFDDEDLEDEDEDNNHHNNVAQQRGNREAEFCGQDDFSSQPDADRATNEDMEFQHGDNYQVQSKKDQTPRESISNHEVGISISKSLGQKSDKKSQQLQIQSDYQEIQEALQDGIRPDLVDEGTGGTYLLRNKQGKPVFVFKPVDEEPNGMVNPKGGFQQDRSLSENQSSSLNNYQHYPGTYNAPRVSDSAFTHYSSFNRNFLGGSTNSKKRGTQPGQGAFREVAAYLLDANNFCNVPQTVLASLKGKQGSVLSKLGSLQKFVENQGSCEQYGHTFFPTQQVHRICLLDIRLANADRNAGNILFTKSKGNEVVLVPIDHGLCLPSSVEDVFYEWMDWPQSKEKFSEECKLYIQQLNASKDIHKLQHHGVQLGEKAEFILRVNTELLKIGAKMDCSPYQIGLVVMRYANRKAPLEKLLNNSVEEVCRELRDKQQFPLNYKKFNQVPNRFFKGHSDKLLAAFLPVLQQCIQEYAETSFFDDLEEIL